ncbi:PLDc N-terminal domain-containing protein [Flaviaesturariibacter amylovorans]|uniref:Cardiolipin synthase N-terminal domain-containing protein n=1 Tax=Flaviaesturariibacter amylovorans TaxID=1084520 RepID=A0ABP8GBA7_9BACT
MNDLLENLLAPALFAAAIIGAIALYLFCVFDIQKRPVRYLSQKSMWLNIVWLMPVIGAFLYLSQRRRYWRRLDAGPDPSAGRQPLSSGNA